MDRFHDLFYGRWRAGGDTINLSWFGYPLVKSPSDMWMYQELLVRTRPDTVVETGTFHGGSALFFAMMLDLLGHGSVITIDVNHQPDLPAHPRIEYVLGSSTDPALVAEVKKMVSGNVMVVLDSDHSAAHVYDELVAYSPLVAPGHYLIVEDTNVNGHPVRPDFGPGPMEAVHEFLKHTNDFYVDERCERFLMTLHPGGYLRRKTPA